MAVQKTTFAPCLTPPSSGFGGLAIGGEGIQPFVTSGNGGLAIGGFHVDPFITVGYGGLAVGGSGISPTITTLGGIAIGGSGFTPPLSAGFGGVAIGGESWQPNLSPPPATVEHLPTTANGISWNNPNNILACDATYATIFAAGVPSLTLQGATFAFAIPGGSTIDAIEAKVTCHESAAAIKLNHLVLIGNFGTSNDLGTNTEIALVDTEYVFGSAVDLTPWGVSPSVADVNNANFTLEIGVQAISGMGPQMLVDCMHIKIYYH